MNPVYNSMILLDELHCLFFSGLRPLRSIYKFGGITATKVPKNGARLSWGLSCTMGFPDVGRSIFVSPFSACDSDSQICKCKQLYLSMVHPKDGVDGRMETIGVMGGNGDIGSPKTPSSVQSRVSASVAGNSEFETRKGSSLCWDNSVARLAMEDDKAKEMLETFPVRWLHHHHLLIRNFVIVPIMGQFCVFQVEGADSLNASSDTQCLINNKISGVLACETHISDSMGEIDAALLVDTRIKIHLSDPKSKIQGIPRGSMSNTAIDKKVGDVPRLGGLSKEFAALKEIITFSLLNKNALLPRNQMETSAIVKKLSTAVTNCTFFYLFRKKLTKSGLMKRK